MLMSISMRRSAATYHALRLRPFVGAQPQIKFARAFSSSTPTPSSSPEPTPPPPQAQNLPPTVYDGWAGLSAFGTRVQERLPSFNTYQDENVFPSQMSLLKRYLLFARLQLPTQTEIDAVEFINGAQHAVDLALHTMFSKEIAQYAFGESNDAKAAKKLQQIMSPMCYDMFYQGLAVTKGTMKSMELKSLDIKAMHLVDISWEKLTVAEIKQQEINDMVSTQDLIKGRFALEHMAQNPTKMPQDPLLMELPGLSDVDSIVIDEQDHEKWVERMRVSVVAFTAERVVTHTIDGGEQATERDVTGIWRFESNVTTPEDIDWRILTFMEVTPGASLSL